MLGPWVLIRTSGPVIGGVTIFGLNVESGSTGGISLAMIGTMFFGPFSSLFPSLQERCNERAGPRSHWRK